MMLQLLGTFAEFERARIGERISDVLGDKRRQNKVYSRRTPFGYRREGDRLVADLKQQAALAEMRRMHADGASLRQIAAYANGLNVRPGPFYAQTVKVILESRMASAG